MLLRCIESSIEGRASQYIRDVFAVMYSEETCNVIRNTLEKFFDRVGIILEHTFCQVK